MATISGLRRLAVTGALLAAATTTFACQALYQYLPGGTDVKKLYIKDYTLKVGARLIAGTSSKEFEDAKILNIKTLGNIGLVYSPNYIFVADPELVITATNPITLPPSELVDEPAGFDEEGAVVMEKVLRKPLYIIQKTTLTYAVPGFTIPPVTITQQIPIKANDYKLKLSGVAQVNELMAAFAQDPAKLGTVAGTVTISVDVQDLDPLARERTFVVARSFPLSYAYLPFRPETTEGGGEAPAPVETLPPATPEPTPTPTPTPSPTPTPVANNTAPGSISVLPTPIATTSAAP